MAIQGQLQMLCQALENGQPPPGIINYQQRPHGRRGCGQQRGGNNGGGGSYGGSRYNVGGTTTVVAAATRTQTVAAVVGLQQWQPERKWQWWWLQQWRWHKRQQIWRRQPESKWPTPQPNQAF
jgi:hypothetical protein